MTILIVAFLILLIIALALNTTMSDEDKIRAYIEEQGYEFISSSRNWKSERFEGRGHRHYSCSFRDAAGHEQEKQLKVRWGEVKEAAQ